MVFASLAETVARAMHADAQSNGRGWWEVGHVCHSPERATATRSNRKLGIRDDPGRAGWLRVKCFAGCDRRRVIDALEAVSGISIRSSDNPALHRSEPPYEPVVGSTVGMAKATGNSIDESLEARRSNVWRAQLFKSIQPLPPDPMHPAHLWATRFAVELTDLIRWLPCGSDAYPESWREAGEVGAIAAPLHRLCDGRRIGAAFVFVSSAGDKVGVDKRTLSYRVGGTAGSLGFVRRERSPKLHLAEGLKDALAVASLRDDRDSDVGFMAGKSNITAAPTWDALARVYEEAWIWADDETGALQEAHGVVWQLKRRGMKALVIRPHGKDPADALLAARERLGTGDWV